MIPTITHHHSWNTLLITTARFLSHTFKSTMLNNKISFSLHHLGEKPFFFANKYSWTKKKLERPNELKSKVWDSVVLVFSSHWTSTWGMRTLWGGWRERLVKRFKSIHECLVSCSQYLHTCISHSMNTTIYISSPHSQHSHMHHLHLQPTLSPHNPSQILYSQATIISCMHHKNWKSIRLLSLP